MNLSYFKCPTEGIWINSFFPRPPHFSKFILILLSVKHNWLQITNTLLKIISTCLYSKSEVLTSNESKIGYNVWRIGGLSRDVDVDVDIDIDVDFEQLEGAFLQISGIDTRSIKTNLLSLKYLLILSLVRDDLIDASV